MNREYRHYRRWIREYNKSFYGWPLSKYLRHPKRQLLWRLTTPGWSGAQLRTFRDVAIVHAHYHHGEDRAVYRWVRSKTGSRYHMLRYPKPPQWPHVTPAGVTEPASLAEAKERMHSMVNVPNPPRRTWRRDART